MIKDTIYFQLVRKTVLLLSSSCLLYGVLEIQSAHAEELQKKQTIITPNNMQAEKLYDAQIIGKSQFADQKVKADDPGSELLLADVNKYLNKHGLNMGFDWVTETAGVVRGGRKKGVDYTQQFALTFDMDWEKIAGIKGFSTHANFLHRSGRNASADYLGDSQIQAQEVYGGGYSRFIRMYDLYFEEHLFNDRFEIKGGRVSTGDDFSHSPMNCQFMVLATCGHPRSVQSQQGFSDWPGSVWGGRILVRPTKESYFQIGGYQSIPWPQGGRTGWDWGNGKSTGAYIPWEFGYAPEFGKDHLNGHIKIGGGFDTSKFATWSGKATGTGKKDYRTQFWLQIDQMVYRNDSTTDHGLYVLANWGHDSPTTSTYKDFYNFGILDRGFWKKRPTDQFGLMMTYYTVPRGLSRAQQYQINHGQDMVHGQFSILNGAPGVQSNAMIFEANYGFVPYRGIMVQPVFEYFHHIAATRKAYNDGAILGLKTHVLF